MIKISNLDKYYNKGKANETHAINNCNITFPETGLVAILGESGSGKSSLLACIGGLDKANGEIDYGNFKMAKFNQNAIDDYRINNIGYVFQNYQLCLDMSVYDNLAFVLDLMGIRDKNEQEKRINYVLTSLGMYKYRKRMAGQLSGGQMQRVSIARALVKDSKIILADEPTGNLDSKTSFEVLNILKKISKNRLVIIVTHNKKLAEFFSDRILKIEDGRIVEDRSVTDDSLTYDLSDKQAIYLKDLNETNINSHNINASIYSDTEDVPQIDLKIIYKNGKLFFYTNQDISLLNDSSHIKVLDEHYEAIKKENVDDFSFDTSNFDSKVEKEKFSFKKFMKRIGVALRNVLFVKKKTKAAYVAFGFIGALYAVGVILISSIYYVSPDNITGLKDSYTTASKLNKDESKEYFDVVSKGIEAGIVTDFYSSNVQEYINVLGINANVDSVGANTYVKPISTFKETLISGNTISARNEIIISTKLLEKINDNEFVKYDKSTILNKPYSITSRSNKGTICGVFESSEAVCYVSNYASFNAVYNSSSYELSYDYIREGINYTIIIGEDISAGKVILPYSEYYKYKDAEDSSYSLNDTHSYPIAGYYSSNTTNAVLFADNETLSTVYHEVFLQNHTIITCDPFVNIVEGKMPVSDNEILVPTYLNYNVGDYYDDYIICGKYAAEYTNSAQFYVSYQKALSKSFDENKAYLVYSQNTMITFRDNNEGVKYFADHGYTLGDTYDINYKAAQSNNIASKVSYFIFAGITLGISIVFIFLMLRSRMISNIKEIGTLRAIGIKKAPVYKYYLLELIVMTTISTVLGYLIVFILAKRILDSLTFLSGVFVATSLAFVIGLVLIYALSLLFGMLPVFMLMHKTPSEISSKYDI